MITIHESGMTFGPFASEDLYHIENSPALQQLGDHIKMAEFIVHSVSSDNTKQVSIIEAKSSIPRQTDDYFNDIIAKLLNAVTILLNGSLGRLTRINTELPSNFCQLDWRTTAVRLILVIKSVPDSMLPQITDKLRMQLITIRKTWAIAQNNIWVFNETKARAHGLVI